MNYTNILAYIKSTTLKILDKLSTVATKVINKIIKHPNTLDRDYYSLEFVAMRPFLKIMFWGVLIIVLSCTAFGIISLIKYGR